MLKEIQPLLLQCTKMMSFKHHGLTVNISQERMVTPRRHTYPDYNYNLKLVHGTHNVRQPSLESHVFAQNAMSPAIVFYAVSYL